MNSAHLLKYSLESLYSATLWIQLLHFLLHAIYLKALFASYLLIYDQKIIMCTFLLPGLDTASVSSSREEMVHCGYTQMDTVSSSAQAVVFKDAQLRGQSAFPSFSDSPTTCTSLATDVRVTDRHVA